MRVASASSLLLLLLVGCAGTHTPAIEKAQAKPLTPQQTKAFDRGVDLVATLDGLDGRWRDDYDQELQTRIGGADLIAAVTVKSTLADSDPSQNVSYHLVAHVDRELLGKDSDHEIELISNPGDPGYNTVAENIAHITEQPFVAYVLAAPNGLAWHLSPASKEVVEETESQITVLRRTPEQGQREIVIVR